MLTKRIVFSVLFIAVLAFLSGSCTEKSPTPGTSEESIKPQAEVWTCSMHPEISKPAPGKCPKCGMDLILKKTDTPMDSKDSMHKSAEDMPADKTAEQTVCPVMGGKINKDIFVEYEGRKIYFCCDGCPQAFKKDPAKYMAKLK